MQEWAQRHSFFLFTFLWLILFFPSWYALSYTKVRELQRLLFRSAAVQLEVLHPTGEMKQLLELKTVLDTQFSEQKVAVLAPLGDERSPLATDLSMLRAVFHPVPVITQEEEINQEVLVVFGRASEDPRCEQLSTETGFTGEVLCWPMQLP